MSRYYQLPREEDSAAKPDRSYAVAFLSCLALIAIICIIALVIIAVNQVAVDSPLHTCSDVTVDGVRTVVQSTRCGGK